MAALKIITLNTGNSLVLGGLLSIIRLENPDIVLLQEITVTTGQLQLFVAKFGYSAEANTDLLDITRLGTGIIWKSELPISEITSVVDCRAQLAKLGPYHLLNLYAPSGSNNRTARRDFFGQDIFRLIRGVNTSEYPLLAGDFNCVLSPMDTERNFGDKNCAALKDLLTGFNYADAFRIVKPNITEFTFHRKSSAPSRLDRFYVPPFCVPFVQDVSHHASLSDHHYGVLILNLPNLDCAPKPLKNESLYWKLNTNILQDRDFLENFQETYSKLRTKIPDYPDIADWWDLCAKPTIRDFCMGVSQRLAFVRKNTKRFLFSYLTLVIKRGNWKEVVRVRKEIRKLLYKESMGFMIRSRFGETIETEKSSLFYMNRENKNFAKNSMNELKINKKVTSDKASIEKAVLDYFGALFNGHHDRNGVDSGQPFQPDYSGLPDFLAGLGCLSLDSQAELIKDLSYEEIKHIVMKECSSNKSPGLDGIPYEFYQVTWGIIGHDFVNVLQTQLVRLTLIESDRHGATRVCSKVNGVPDVSELRPITLLNCDYKILSKSFVKRLCPVLPEIIKSGQLCSVKEKNILFGVSNVISALDYVEAHKVAAYMVSLDMFKAYDRVLLDYLVRVMAAMKFPHLFIQWIQMLHDGATTYFLLNFLTDPMKVIFSIRQGDPLSMILYIIYIEPLLLMIGRRTKGLSMASFSQKDEDYCDDLNFLSECEDDLITIEDIFVKFEDISGALLSRSWKSKIMGLGPWQNRLQWPLPWLQPKPELKIFGFQFCPSYKRTLEKCWTECFSGFQNTLMSWSSRQLDTLVQRVEVLRIFATSKLWYKASALPIPPKFTKKFEAAMVRFLWVGKLEKLKIDEIKNPVLSGGLNLPCIISKADSLFLSQSCRLLKYPASKQYSHVKYWLGLYVKDIFPDMGVGPHAELVSPYFQHMKSLLTGAVILEDIDVTKLNLVTAKGLYEGFSSTFPPPKVVYKYDVDWDLVWIRQQNPVLDIMGKEILFLLVHNIIANKDRVYKFHLTASPNCSICGVLQDNVHLFCECLNVREAWFWMRQRLLGFLPEGHQLSNFEFINLMFPSSPFENEIVWLLGVYVHQVWINIICKKKILSQTQIKTEVAQHYLDHQSSSRPSLVHITGLN